MQLCDFPGTKSLLDHDFPGTESLLSLYSSVKNFISVYLMYFLHFSHFESSTIYVRDTLTVYIHRQLYQPITIQL